MNILSSLVNKVRKDFGIVMGVLLAGMITNASAVNVTVSIPPLAGMIAPIMGENDTVNVILKPGASPHGFQLKPSNLATLQQSDLVVWVGTPVDWWMEKPLANLHSKQLAMHDLPQLKTLPVREGGLWESHAHHDHDDHGHDKHEHDKHEHDKHAGHGEHHSEGSEDGHLWMSYENSVLLIKAVSRQLQQQYPQRVSEFKANTQAWLTKLQQSENKVAQQLKRVNDVPYMVLHDAFQYFEKRYQLNGVGSIQLNPGVAPSLKRVHELRKKVQAGAVRCVFKEPQFPEKRVSAVTKGLQVNIGLLDPMGSSAAQQKNVAFLTHDQFIEELAQQFYHCLSR